jgi:hypothetical protein
MWMFISMTRHRPTPYSCSCSFTLTDSENAYSVVAKCMQQTMPTQFYCSGVFLPNTRPTIQDDQLAPVKANSREHISNMKRLIKA